MTARRFSLRGLTTMIVALAFLVLTATGVALYVAPSRWFALETDWRFLGLDKMQIVALHIIASLTFLAVAVLHLCFNWRAFTHFLRTRAEEGRLGIRWEFPLALAVVAVISIGAILEWTPFNKIVAFSQEMRRPAAGGGAGAPEIGGSAGRGPRMQRPSPPQGAAGIGGVPQGPQSGALPAMRSPRVNGTAPVAGAPTATGGRAGAAPRTGATAGPRPMPQQRGATQARRPSPRWGRMTLEAVCKARNAAIDKVLAELERMGVEAQPADNVKELADAIGLTPPDFVEKLMPQAAPDANASRNSAPPAAHNDVPQGAQSPQ